MRKDLLKGILKDRYETALNGENLPKTLILEKELAPKIFTSKRVELLEAILQGIPSSVTDLASKLGRARENVTRDLNYLEGLNVISYTKEKGRKIPRINAELILIPLETTTLADYLGKQEKAAA